MKEQTRLELNISSLIWENWTNQKRSKKDQSQHNLLSGINLFPPTKPPSEPVSIPAYLVLNVCVFEHQRQWSDVLPVHTITASNLNGVLDAFVDLLGGGLP